MLKMQLTRDIGAYYKMQQSKRVTIRIYQRDNKQINKRKWRKVEVDDTLEMIEGIVKYLQDAEDKHETTQHHAGFKELFTDLIVKD